MNENIVNIDLMDAIKSYLRYGAERPLTLSEIETIALIRISQSLRELTTTIGSGNVLPFPVTSKTETLSIVNKIIEGENDDSK